MAEEKKRICNCCGSAVRCMVTYRGYRFYSIIERENKDKKEEKIFVESCPECGAKLSINTTEPSSTL